MMHAAAVFPVRHAKGRGFRLLVLAIVLALPAFWTGCGGSDSTKPEAPTVTLSSPQDGATVSGAVTLTAAATHCDRVAFFVDGAKIDEDATSPYAVTWNSGLVANGTHTLKARAEGGGGAAEDAITVTVSNEAGTVVVVVTPGEATVTVGTTQQFTASVSGSANTQVTWSVNEGAARGTITQSGLYTAPASVPSPATATVKATSVADPTKSATATVTLVGSGGETISAEEKDLCYALFWVAHDPSELAVDAIELGAEAVWGASELKGSATLTGTLTQSAPNSEVWSYSSSPSDKLVIAYAGGPTVEYVFSGFDGYTDGTWQDFLDQHNLTFTARIAGVYDVTVQSQIGFVGGVEVPYTWKTQWTRSVTGSAVHENVSYNLNVSETGTQQGYTESGWAGLQTEKRIQGTATSASGQFDLDEYYWTEYTHRSDIGHIIRNWQMTVNNTASAGGTTYTYDTASARWECNTLVNDPGAFNRVVEPDYWRVMGTLLKNNVAYGQVDFDGAVVKDTNGPNLVLRFHTGEELFLHTLVPDPGQ